MRLLSKLAPQKVNCIKKKEKKLSLLRVHMQQEKPRAFPCVYILINQKMHTLIVPI